MLRKVLWCALLVFSVYSQAEVVEIRKVKLFGTACRAGRAQLLNNGNDFALVFDAFSVDLPQGDLSRPFGEVETCNVILDLTIPQGYCLNSVRHVITGGVLKTRHSVGWAQATFAVGGIAKTIVKHFGWNDEIRPEDDDSFFAPTLEKGAGNRCVKGNVKYFLDMISAGSRATRRNDGFILQMDSVDGSFLLRQK